MSDLSKLLKRLKKDKTLNRKLRKQVQRAVRTVVQRPTKDLIDKLQDGWQ